MPTSNLKTCFIHIGTHKTGTSSVQAFLRINDLLLGERGVFVPRFGRPLNHFANDQKCGHHNVPWEMLEGAQFEPENGGLLDVVHRVYQSGLPVAVISSEDFSLLYQQPGALAKINETFLDAGYQPKPILYLRSRGNYVDSLYAELLKHGIRRSYDDFLEEILEAGAARFDGRSFPFQYSAIADAYADAFGKQNLVVRSYDLVGSGNDLLLDFLKIVVPGFNTNEFSDFEPTDGRQNPSLSTRDSLNAMWRQLTEGGSMALPRVDDLIRETCGEDEPRFLGKAFAALCPGDHLRLGSCFSGDTSTILEHYGIVVRTVSRKTFGSPADIRDRIACRMLMRHVASRWGLARSRYRFLRPISAITT